MNSIVQKKPDIAAASAPHLADRLDEIIAMPDASIAARPAEIAAELLAIGEAVLKNWLSAKGKEPTKEKSEGFRLLALHRQGARGDPSFNACRETCRELVYHYNCICLDSGSPETLNRVRYCAMIARHLLLFIDGKLENADLGEFCCSSRSIRLGEAARSAQDVS